MTHSDVKLKDHLLDLRFVPKNKHQELLVLETDLGPGAALLLCVFIEMYSKGITTQVPLALDGGVEALIGIPAIKFRQEVGRLTKKSKTHDRSVKWDANDFRTHLIAASTVYREKFAVLEGFISSAFITMVLDKTVTDKLTDGANQGRHVLEIVKIADIKALHVEKSIKRLEKDGKVLVRDIIRELNEKASAAMSLLNLLGPKTTFGKGTWSICGELHRTEHISSCDYRREYLAVKDTALDKIWGLYVICAFPVVISLKLIPAIRGPVARFIHKKWFDKKTSDGFLRECEAILGVKS